MERNLEEALIKSREEQQRTYEEREAAHLKMQLKGERDQIENGDFFIAEAPQMPLKFIFKLGAVFAFFLALFIDSIIPFLFASSLSFHFFSRPSSPFSPLFTIFGLPLFSHLDAVIFRSILLLLLPLQLRAFSRRFRSTRGNLPFYYLILLCVSVL